MAGKKTARGSCDYRRARVSTNADTRSIQQEWERGTLWGGVIIAVAFGLMLVIGAWFGW